MYYTKAVVLSLAVLAVGSVTDEKSSNRIVRYYQRNFLEKHTIPAPFKASLIRRPKHYEDSKQWSLNSILLLMVLLKDTKVANPVLEIFKSTTDSPKVNQRVENSVEESVLSIANHEKAHLPDSMISFRIIKSYLEPQEIVAWLKSRPLKGHRNLRGGISVGLDWWLAGGKGGGKGKDCGKGKGGGDRLKKRNPPNNQFQANTCGCCCCNCCNDCCGGPSVNINTDNNNNSPCLPMIDGSRVIKEDD